MAAGTLYTYPDNFRAYKVLIAAKYSGVEVKISSDFVFGVSNKNDDFLKKFPLGKVPAFETNDGHHLIESNAIAHYVANDQLRGKSPTDQALIMQWCNFADSEILPASTAWTFPLMGIFPYNKQTVENAKEDVKKALACLNEHLHTKTYLVGERITLADICVSMTLLNLYQYVMDTNTRKPYQNVNRWFLTILNQPEVSSVVGTFNFIEKAVEYDPKKSAETQAKSSKKEKKEKELRTPKEDKKKEKEKEPAEEPDASEIVLAAEPKSTNPFDSMPKGTFDFEDYKRFYSNNDEDKSIPYFWEKFDPQNCSIWFCEYKYADELTKTFMSCNLISGMYQRLDKMRKASFASMCLFGEDNNSTISGIWVWRGQDLAFTLCSDWQIDFESYDWKKLNPSDEKTKELVKQYFSWVGTDKDGRKFKEGKIFK